MRKILGILPLLALAGCMTPYGDPYGQSGYPEPYPPPQGYPPAPYPEPYPPQGYPVPPGANDYRASGTEPFWDLTIGRDITFNDRGTGLTVVQPTPQAINGVAGEIYRTQRLEVNITHSRCNDGMSDRTYPDTVQVYVDGRLYRGCGGAASASDPLAPIPPGAAPPPPPSTVPPPPPVAGMPAPPLDRTRWRVIAINGRPVPPNGDYGIEFDNGRLSARFGCNSMGATYTQTGSNLDAGPITATEMACPDMSWERDGARVLEPVLQVTALTPHRITLTSSAGSIELVRR